jgi:hypothetical protein
MENGYLKLQLNKGGLGLIVNFTKVSLIRCVVAEKGPKVLSTCTHKPFASHPDKQNTSGIQSTYVLPATAATAVVRT